MTRLGSKGCKILSHLKSVLKKDARSSPHFADRQKRILQKADDPQALRGPFSVLESVQDYLVEWRSTELCAVEPKLRSRTS